MKKMTHTSTMLTICIVSALVATMFTGCNKSSNFEFATQKIDWCDSTNEGRVVMTNELHVAYPLRAEQPLLDSTRNLVCQWLANYVERYDWGAPYSGPIENGDVVLSYYENELQNNTLDSFFGDDDEFRESIQYDGDGNRITSTYGLFTYLEIIPICISSKFVTYIKYFECDLGGAHGAQDFDYATILSKDGSTVDWDIFREDTKSDLAVFVRTCILSSYFRQEDPTTNDPYCLFPSAFENFPLPSIKPALMANGIIFFYQSYEIAPYIAGRPACLITYDMLTKYMTDEGVALVEDITHDNFVLPIDFDEDEEVETDGSSEETGAEDVA